MIFIFGIDRHWALIEGVLYVSDGSLSVIVLYDGSLSMMVLSTSCDWLGSIIIIHH